MKENAERVAGVGVGCDDDEEERQGEEEEEKDGKKDEGDCR